MRAKYGYMCGNDDEQTAREKWNRRVMSEIDRAEEQGVLVDALTSVGASGVQAQLEIIRAAALLRFASIVIDRELCPEFFDRCGSWIKRNGEEDANLDPELESWLILKMLGQRGEES
jgi:hypothetical protein